MNSQHHTRLTLIQRAKSQGDEEAWQEFIHYYRAFIFSLLNSMHVPACDCDDLAQKILLKLWQNLPNYEKQNAKFRSWLSTIIRNTALSYFRSQEVVNKHFVSHEEFSENILISDQTELEQLIEEDWKKHLTELAIERIEKAYRGKALEVFKMTLAGKQTQQISEELQLSQDSVYTLRNRVKKSFVNELRRLMAELEF